MATKKSLYQKIDETQESVTNLSPQFNDTEKLCSWYLIVLQSAKELSKLLNGHNAASLKTTELLNLINQLNAEIAIEKDASTSKEKEKERSKVESELKRIRNLLEQSTEKFESRQKILGYRNKAIQIAANLRKRFEIAQLVKKKMAEREHQNLLKDIVDIKTYEGKRRKEKV